MDFHSKMYLNNNSRDTPGGKMSEFGLNVCIFRATVEQLKEIQKKNKSIQNNLEMTLNNLEKIPNYSEFSVH